MINLTINGMGIHAPNSHKSTTCNHLSPTIGSPAQSHRHWWRNCTLQYWLPTPMWTRHPNNSTPSKTLQTIPKLHQNGNNRNITSIGWWEWYHHISQSQSFESSIYYEHLWINAGHRTVDIQKGLFGVNCVGSKSHSINFRHRILIFCSYSYIKVYHVPNYQNDAICRTKKQRTGSSITTSSSTSNSNENHTTIYVYSKKKETATNT